jgi:hypothetical protein
MKAVVLAVGLCVVGASAAFAVEGANPADKFTALRSIQAPKALAAQELAKIEGQAITTQTTITNPGGQSPQGGGATNGQAIQTQTVSVNPAGHAPAGQNK